MKTEAMILVLSDLHFGRELIHAPELPPLEFSRAAKWLRKEKEVQKFFEQNCGGHSVPCVTMLPRYLKSLLRDAIENEGYQENETENFDLCLLLGDQATFPDAQAYAFLREYLTALRHHTRENLSCAGLGFRKDQILAIPGNHDKLLRSNLDIYHNEFEKKLDLPSVRPQECVLVTRIIRDREFLFLLLDASSYAPRDMTVDLDCRTHLAQGEVSDKLRSTIKGHLTSLRDGYAVGYAVGNKVVNARLERGYGNAVKIMLVHYAVDEQRLPRDKQWRARFLPHRCSGLDPLVRDLRIDFQFNVVLHGHLHVAGLYNHSGAQVVAATTTTERNGPNGFYVIKVLETGQIQTEHHCWIGNKFSPDSDRSLSRPLETHPTGAAA